MLRALFHKKTRLLAAVAIVAGTLASGAGPVAAASTTASTASNASVPAPGTDITALTDGQLATYHLPPRPASNSGEYPGWQKAMKAMKRDTANVAPTPDPFPAPIAGRAVTGGGWAGPFAFNDGYTQVQGSWNVPTPFSSDSHNRYSVQWVGLNGECDYGGCPNSGTDLVQAGSEVDTIAGTPMYYAWWEILPNYPSIQRVNLNDLTIYPGDTMFVSINTSSTQSNIFIEDETTRVGYPVPSQLTAYGCSCVTAEGVNERTANTDSGLMTFDNPVFFNGVAAADINGTKFINQFADATTSIYDGSNVLSYLVNGLGGIGSNGNYEVDRTTFNDAPPPYLTDDWTGSNGSSWNGSNWVTTTNSSTKIVDIQNNQGRLYTNGSSVRGTAQMSAVSDSDVYLTYRFNESTTGSNFRIFTRASGATGANQMPNAYRLNVGSGSTSISLERFQNSAVSTLTSFPYTSGTATQDVRFRVQGGAIYAKVWPDGTTEPANWQVSWTDLNITTPGVVQLTNSYTSGAHTVYIDKLSVNPL
jgi:hypothetical protein